MKKIMPFAALLLMTACSNNDKSFDATGTFEATEVTVSAEQTGKLLHFDVEEGGKVVADWSCEDGLSGTETEYKYADCSLASAGR